MANILKCKMCGGDITVSADMTVGTCQYCGSTMTLPRIDSDKKARLFNRANEYRLNCEYDKAYDAYKTITEEDEQEAEAYWGMILSEYGIEYVEDPQSQKRIATCHRTKIQNIQGSVNFNLAIKYADAERRLMYRDEAEVIDKLQRQILATSSKETEYDVFICYKELGEDGQRTKDSVLAQDIYNELEKEGIKTFFSRISLENHIGENYEPYIYGALSSARVMLIVATNGEYLDAVWVKNEWKRYISFMDKDSNKTIIPVYQDMSPYEFPTELSKYQAQDMSKIGSLQDLVRGIKKILGKASVDSNNKVINELVAEKRKRERNKKIIIRIIAIVAVMALFIVSGYTIYFRYYYPESIYKKALKLKDEKQYQEAIELLLTIDDYAGSEAIRQETKRLLFEELVSSGDVDRAKLYYDENKELIGVEGLISIFESCLLEKKYTEAESIISEFEMVYEETDLDQYSNYLNSLLLLCKLKKEDSFDHISENFANWKEKISILTAIYYSQERDMLYVVRPDGSVYLAKYKNLYSKTDATALMDSKRYSHPGVMFHYDYLTNKCYMTYQSLVFDMDFIDDKSFNLIAEDKSGLEMIHGNETFKSCEGKYVKK